MSALYVVAERENPRRRFLFVSTVLAKHLPVPAPVALLAGAALGLRVIGDPRAPSAQRILEHADVTGARALHEDLAARPAGGGEHMTVIGFAETATALGHQLARTLGARYLHSTRRRLPDAVEQMPFVEEHSHAQDQWLAAPARAHTVVLVDDEYTTGRTARHLIAAAHPTLQASRYVLAGLIDRLSEDDHAALQQIATDLGCTIDMITLASAADAQLPDEQAPAVGVPPVASAPGRSVVSDRVISSPVPVTARTGLTSEQHVAYDDLARRCALNLHVDVVLGTGEFMYLPQLIADRCDAVTWATTRSPIRVAQASGYPITAGITFAGIDDPGPNYLYSTDMLAGRDVAVCFEDQAARAAGADFLRTLAGARSITALTFKELPR